MRIFYVGDLDETGTCMMRFKAFQALGHSVEGIDLHVHRPPSFVRSFVRRVAYKLRVPLDETQANELLVQKTAAEKYDVVWIDKGITIRSDTLRQVQKNCPDTTIAGYSPDDMAAKHNNSRYFVAGLPYYDVFFTSKSYGVAELEAMGLPKAFFSPNAYDPATHHPIEIDEATRREFGSPVGFIGTYEIDRATSISYLIKNGVDVRIHGSAWEEAPARLNLPKVLPPVLGLSYSKAICATDINLCFLRKINRDLQTHRTVELPAAGAFMLAERTNEHLEMFEEGKEAEFFDSDKELLEKVRYYLDHPEERRRIAAAGLQRCLRSGYSYQERLAVALRQLQEWTAA